MGIYDRDYMKNFPKKENLKKKKKNLIFFIKKINFFLWRILKKR
jgi:hypothetical protein